MKTLLTLASVLVASSAFAGNLKTPELSDPIVLPPVASAEKTWTGFTLGASVGNASVAESDFSERRIGGYANYRYQFDNNIVVGAEAFMGTYEVFDEYDVTSKGVEVQAGYAMGNWLPYASFGRTWEESSDIGYDSFSNAMSVGLDYNMDGWVFGGKATKYEANSDALLLEARVGFRF